VPRPGEGIGAAEISAHCASQLVGYKCPTEVRVLEHLPITGAQKLDRIALRRAAARGEQDAPQLSLAETGQGRIVERSRQ
jgi:long-chain acyl-CoA synthetase